MAEHDRQKTLYGRLGGVALETGLQERAVAARFIRVGLAAEQQLEGGPHGGGHLLGRRLAPLLEHRGERGEGLRLECLVNQLAVATLDRAVMEEFLGDPLAGPHVDLDLPLADAVGGRVIGKRPLGLDLPGGHEVGEITVVALAHAVEPGGVGVVGDPPHAAGSGGVALGLAGEQELVIHPVAAGRGPGPRLVHGGASGCERGADPVHRRQPHGERGLLGVGGGHATALELLVDLLPRREVVGLARSKGGSER